MASKEVQIYDIIEKRAGSNIAMQGLSGLMGFPFTLAADVAVFFTHYGPMLNDIRAAYHRSPVTAASMAPILKGCKQVVGNIPLFGLPANMICAKAMTWRLGILFGMLSARGEEIDLHNVLSAVRLIRELFPQRESFLFKKPSASLVEKLLLTVEGDSVESFEQKMDRILDALAS